MSNSEPTRRNICYGTKKPLRPVPYGAPSKNRSGRAPYPSVAGNYMHFYDNIYDVIRKGKPAEITHTEMMDDIRILDAIFESDRAGMTISF